jgi:hypothetical protein
MTIMLRTSRPRFAIIAAERLASWAAGSGTPTETQKIVLHPSLPLAIGVANALWWVIPCPRQAGPTTSLLQQFIEQIVSPSELELESIAHRLREIFGPGFAEMKQNVCFTIAVVHDGRASVALQIIGETTSLVQGYETCQIAPDSYFEQAQLAALHDQRVNCPLEVVERARQLVVLGIAREEGTPVENRRVGGPIDVVLVSETAVLSTFRS